MHFAIYGSRHQDKFIGAIADFLRGLARDGHTAVMHTKLYRYLLHCAPGALECVRRVTDGDDFTADYAVSLGGDGTFLRTAAWIGDKEIPVIGVNTGHLGFLASLGAADLPSLARLLAAGDFALERRSIVSVGAPGLTGWPYAVNEVTVTRAESASMLHVRVTIDSIPLADYRADGLIVSTPTGSTAYNLSVGGPIVQPSAPVLVLSPIAAHSLSMRPLVVADTSRLSLRCSGRGTTMRLSLDGRAVQLPMGTTVTIERAPFALLAVQAAGHNFADTLRSKLQWG